MAPQKMIRFDKRQRERMTRGEAALLALGVVVGWLAVFGAARVLELAARWVAS